MNTLSPLTPNVVPSLVSLGQAGCMVQIGRKYVFITCYTYWSCGSNAKLRKWTPKTLCLIECVWGGEGNKMNWQTCTVLEYLIVRWLTLDPALSFQIVLFMRMWDDKAGLYLISFEFHITFVSTAARNSCNSSWSKKGVDL